MHDCGTRKPDTNNQTLPWGVPPMEGWHNKVQYPEEYKNAIEKRFWSGKDNGYKEI